MRKKNELTHHLDIFGVALLLLVISELPPVTIAIRVPLQKFGVCFTRCLCIVLKNHERIVSVRVVVFSFAYVVNVNTK